MLNGVLKLLIILTRNQPVFSIAGLRWIRLFFYRKYFKAPKLFVADGVKITSAHRSDSAHFTCNGKVNLGQYVYIDYSGGVTIGNDVAISDGAMIYTHNHGVHGKHRNWNLNPITFSSLTIEKYVWIGAGAIVSPSVAMIREGSIVAAGAVLTKDTEPYGVYAGNPAKLLFYRKVE